MLQRQGKVYSKRRCRCFDRSSVWYLLIYILATPYNIMCMYNKWAGHRGFRLFPRLSHADIFVYIRSLIMSLQYWFYMLMSVLVWNTLTFINSVIFQLKSILPDIWLRWKQVMKLVESEETFAIWKATVPWIYKPIAIPYSIGNMFNYFFRILLVNVSHSVWILQGILLRKSFLWTLKNVLNSQAFALRFLPNSNDLKTL